MTSKHYCSFTFISESTKTIPIFDTATDAMTDLVNAERSCWLVA